MDHRKKQPARGVGPIVSSAHLADNDLPELSELEYALMVASNAFDRWTVRCMAAAGRADLGALDIRVLHTVNHRGRAKRLADICLVLNEEDTHTVSYSLKKLERLGLVTGSRQGKEKYAAITDDGSGLCKRYAEVREALLVDGLGDTRDRARRISDLAALLRAMSGHYDQAARAATSL